MSDSRRTALVLAHEPDGPAGQIGVRLTERGFDVHTHVITDDYAEPQRFTPWPPFDHFDLVVVMGSVRYLTKKHEISSWIHDEVADVRRTIEAERPVLGICFGGQVIADAMGGSVEAAPDPEVGWFDITPLDGAPSVIAAGPWFEWHHDRFHPPADAQVLADNDAAVQLIRLGRSVGTQFHPEVDTAHVAGFLRDAPADYLAEIGIVPDQMLAEIRGRENDYRVRCNAFVDWYLDEIAFPTT